MSSSLQNRIDYDQDCLIVPTTRRCFYCCKEGKEHPVEHFLCYPCCGYKICRNCMYENSEFCGECLTKIPWGNESALMWITERKPSVSNDVERYNHLLGRVFVYGAHLFLDELLRMPLYNYEKLKPPSLLLAILNPPNVQLGVKYLEMAAKNENISAMLDLADVYCTHFENDPFQRDKQKAEEWYKKALGKNNKIFPLAFTRYGDFLKWEERFVEAKDIYMIAATHGHARGQYEYAVCLLQGMGISDTNGIDGVEGVDKASNEDIEEAICFLCQASEKGFHPPSYTALAKALVDIAEKAYGTVFAVGKSPLPRVMQLLTLAMESPSYGTSEAQREETSKLFEYYDNNTKKKCSNCGQVGTEAHPLRICETCNVIAYCSKVCQKRDYRDGHKFDCCSRADLLNVKSVKLTLPWVSKVGWKREGVEMPCLKNTERRSLIQMVDDETEELYGEEDQDYDEYVLTNLMFRMRKNLETYLNKELKDNTNTRNLQNQISHFSEIVKSYPEHEDFIQAMNTIRTCGNNAVHDSRTNTKKLIQSECEKAVHNYRLQKEKYEKYKEGLRFTTTFVDHGAGNSLSSNKGAKDKTKNNEILKIKQPRIKGAVKQVDNASTKHSNDSAKVQKHALKTVSKVESQEDRLAKCIASKDLRGIDRIISELHGVPGFSKLRKKAKNAAKKLRDKE